MIPDLLTEVLESVGADKRRGCEVGFEFSEHAFAQARDAMDREYVECVDRYTRAAKAYLSGEHSREELIAEVSAIPPLKQETESQAQVEVPALANYVYLLCLRLEEPGTASSKKLLRDLAKEAQLTVAKHAARAAEPDGDGAATQAFAAARWEEARWQLQHVIATEPYPGG